MDDLIFDERAQLIKWRPLVPLETPVARNYFETTAAVEWGNSAVWNTDLSQVPSLDLDYVEMQRVMSLRRTTYKKCCLKLAIYAPKDLDLATSWMYQSLMSDENIEITVSRDLKDLDTFLGRPLASFTWEVLD
ncbi:MAG: hypothetical protein ACI97A_002029 [Planctomycetota bacterium]|jgi:hypothetical protein